MPEPAHRPLVCVQHPGETMFVPGGWWHVVLNLELSLAVTQNFCSRANFDAVWAKTRHSRKKMSVRLQAQLREHEPALYERTLRPIDLAAAGAASSSSSSSSSSYSTSDDGRSDEDDGAAESGRRRRHSRSRSRPRSRSPARADEARERRRPSSRSRSR